jgi:hypothetical protein
MDEVVQGLGFLSGDHGLGNPAREIPGAANGPLGMLCPMYPRVSPPPKTRKVIRFQSPEIWRTLFFG